MTANRRTYGETAEELVDKIAPQPNLEERVDVIFQVMYHGLDDDKLSEMLLYGNEFPPEPEVLAINRSIQEELDRRQREREDLEAER